MVCLLVLLHLGFIWHAMLLSWCLLHPHSSDLLQLIAESTIV
jgi:hypothetical protein